MEEDSKHTYRFFGDLWLEPPEKYLEKDALERLRGIEPLIFKLRYRKPSESSLKLAEAFSAFSKQEQEAWRHLGVDRPRDFLLPPAGDSRAPIACHLYSPTFFTDDPYSQNMLNDSNPTMCQLHQAGFSLENTFFFDHVCRRDRTDDVLLFYSQDILKVHEQFMMSFRRSMGSRLEICWGKPVRDRMKELLDLIPLQLWGEYKEVELFLEIEDDNPIRFILFVYHPQHSFYHSHHTESGVRFRQIKGRRQDFALAVAEASANDQLKEAFPQKYKEIERSAQLLAEKQNMQLENQGDILTLSQRIMGDSCDDGTLRYTSQVVQMTQSWLESVREVFGDGTSVQSLHQVKLISTLKSSDWDDFTQWDEIPSPLVNWIQRQDGLKIDQKPISSIDELIKAYRLLWIKGDPLDQSIMQLLFQVASTYLARVRKQRRQSVRGIFIHGAAPYHIMRRKRSNCGQRILDDAFACYAKVDPKIYLNYYRKDGCGLPDCGKGFTQLIPLDPTRSFRRLTHARFENPRPAEWEDYLLRCSAEECEGLPKVVEAKCTLCNLERFMDQKPRWTSETPAKYVFRIRKCDICERRFCHWYPVDSSIATINQTTLATKWYRMKAAGIEPSKYPRRPGIYWSEKNQSTKLKELEETAQLATTKEEPEDEKPKKKRKVIVRTRMKG